MSHQDLGFDLDVAKQILRCFYRNPQAADTVEGVTRWRLLEETIQSNLEMVMNAMAWLVSRQLLVKESRPGIPALFHLNLEKSDQIRQLLEEAPATTTNRRGKKK